MKKIKENIKSIMSNKDMYWHAYTVIDGLYEEDKITYDQLYELRKYALSFVD